MIRATRSALGCFALLLASGVNAAPPMATDAIDLSRVDHLVYAVPDLAAGSHLIAQLTGVTPAQGGSHPRWGTANTLLSLGKNTYLEIIGPDPEQPEFTGQRVLGVDPAAAPRLTTWAAKGTHLDQLQALLLPGDARIGQAYPGSRERPDGSILRWTLTDPGITVLDGLVPFFIDWGDSPHPTAVAPTGLTLVALHLEHPEPDRVRQALSMLDLKIPVFAARQAAVVATLRGPNGLIVLR